MKTILLKKCNYIRQYLFVISQLCNKDKRIMIAETKIGELWDICDPLLYMAIMSFYYSKIISHDIDCFTVYFFIAYFIFGLFRNSTCHALASLVSNKQLILKSRIPMYLYIDQKIIAAYKIFMYQFIILMVVVLFCGISINVRMLFIIPVSILLILFAIGVGKILSVAYLYFADIQHLYEVFVNLLYWVCAPFYLVEHLSENAQMIIKINPIYSAIHILRNGYIYGINSPTTEWIYLVVWSFSVYLVGTVFFHKSKNNIVNKL